MTEIKSKKLVKVLTRLRSHQDFVEIIYADAHVDEKEDIGAILEEGLSTIISLEFMLIDSCAS